MSGLTALAIAHAASKRAKYKYLTERNRGAGTIKAQNAPKMREMKYKHQLDKRSQEHNQALELNKELNN